MKKPSKKKQIKLLKIALDDSNDAVKKLRVDLNISQAHNGFHVYEIIYLKEKLKAIRILLDNIKL